MPKEQKNILNFTIALVAEFAVKFGIGEKQAFNYLKRFGGMEYLHSFYDVLHTQSFDDAVDSMAVVCSHNGGKLG